MIRSSSHPPAALLAFARSGSAALSRTLAVVVLAAAGAKAHSSSAAADDGSGAECSAFVTKSPLPDVAGIQAHIGPTTTGFALGNGHMMTNMSVPEPVPIGLTCTDIDTLYLQCLRDCVQHDVGGDWTADWSLTDMGLGGDRGSFLDSNGNLVDKVIDSQHVVYLPPRDLACDGFRTIALHARIWDPSPDEGLRDEPIDVWFQVDVWRTSAPSASYFWVMITPQLPPPSQDQPSACADSPDTCCKFVGGNPQMGMPIWADFWSKPDGMLTGDVRMISLKAQDLDLASFECGIAPDCPSAIANELFSDGLSYTWSVLAGPATILQQGRSAVVKAGSSAGRVDLQVVVDDCSGYCYDDPALTLTLSFYVYPLDFIDASNALLPRLGPVSNQNEGLRISQVVTNLAGSMNGCGNVTPTFAGPVPAPPDARTYRLHGTRAGAPAGWSFEVRVRTSHAWPLAEYEGGAEYDHTFATLVHNGAFRSDLHFRLVSNKAPAPGAALDGVYDDEVCGAQSILALPGDWVTATLVVAGKAVGSIELPVERPWNEAVLPAAGPQSIHAASINWMATAGAPGAGKGSFYARRMSEDFAQSAIRGRLVSESSDLQNVTNVLYMSTTNVPAPTPGQVQFSLIDTGGNSSAVTFQVIATDTFATVADKLVAAIDALPGFDATAHHQPLMYQPIDSPYFIVVNRQSEVDFGPIDVGTTGLDLFEPLLDYGDPVLSWEEIIALGLNYKPDLTSTQSAVDVFATTSDFIRGPPGCALTFTTGNHSVNESSMAGVSHTIFLAKTASSGSDETFAQACSHELGHALMDEGDTIHPPAGNNHLLMAGGWPFPPEFDPPERPENIRRMTDAEAADCRSDGAAFLRRPCIPVPRRK